MSISCRGLVEAYELPQQVRVTRGYYGKRSEESLSEGENLTIYFARQEDVVVAQDLHKRDIVIPLTLHGLFRILDRDPKPRAGNASIPQDALDVAHPLNYLVTHFKFPLFVSLVTDANDFASQSSRAGLILQRLEKQESVFATVGRAGDLLCIPMSLDVEFAFPEGSAPKPRKTTENMYASLPEHEALFGDDARGVGTVRLRTLKKRKKEDKRRFTMAAKPTPPPVPRRMSLDLGSKPRRKYLEPRSVSVSESGAAEYATPDDVRPQHRSNKPPLSEVHEYDLAEAVTGKDADQAAREVDFAFAGISLKAEADAEDNPSPNPTARPSSQAGNNSSTGGSKDPPKYSFDELQQFSVQDIQSLLKRMNLSKYCAAFLEQQIDGSVFVLLDDDMLKDDLGVQSRLHRVRLLNTVARTGAVLSLSASC